MMDFHVGQKVVCIDDANTDVEGLRELVEGAVYTVAWYGPSTLPLGHTGNAYGKPGQTIPGLRLAEVRRPFTDLPFAAARFRPLRETNIDIFLAMLEPAPTEKVSA